MPIVQIFTENLRGLIRAFLSGVKEVVYVHDRGQGGSFCQPSPSIHDICLHLIMITKSSQLHKKCTPYTCITWNLVMWLYSERLCWWLIWIG